MLRAEGLRKAYGGVVAVHGVDLEVPAGAIVGLVGNNGAGKSTLLKMLCGLLEPTSGTATVAGHPADSTAARASLGFVPEDSPLYDELTPRQVLRYFARLHDVQRALAGPRAEALLTSLRLADEHRAKPIGMLSKGSARKVALARALLHEPPVLILDEPASGLDPATRAELDAVLLQQRAAGRAILLSAHNMAQVERLCDHVVLMHHGRIGAQGTVAELRRGSGPTPYRVVADRPFPGSSPRDGAYQAVAADLSAAWGLAEQVRAAGGAVLEVAAQPPGLEEILARLEALG